LGQHRRAHIKPSKGKRAAKKQQEKTKDEDKTEPSLAPPLPAISASVDVGLNSIARNLKPEDAGTSKNSPQRQYSMIVVARGDQSSAFNCHFPQMVAVASKGLSPESKIRLVGISKPCSERLSLCLGVPRVSSVAILEDAPGAGALQDLVQKIVSPVDAAWLDPTSERRYLATNIKAIETTIGSKKVKIAQ
jgi:ribonuclease P/MRP protein subunit POP3